MLWDGEQTPLNWVYIIASHKEDKGLNRQITWAKGSPMVTRSNINRKVKETSQKSSVVNFLSRVLTHLGRLQFSSVAQSCPTLCDPMNHSTSGLPVHHQLPEFTQTHVHRVGDAIQPSHPVVPFSPCPQSLPASGSFPMSQLFTWGGQSIAVSASASVLPMNTQDWSSLEWTSWISSQSKGLSRVFSNTTVQKHQFFGTQLSSQSNSHIHTQPLEKP